MTVLVFTVILLVGSYFAGFLGSLTGLGGGVVIIPLLTLLLHVDIHHAIGVHELQNYYHQMTKVDLGRV